MYYENNKQKWIDREKALRERDPEFLKLKTREAQARYRANPDNTIRLRYLKSRYGIDIDEYVRMETEQGNRCAICKGPPLPSARAGAPRLHVDHDHQTGKVRSLLCFKCNAMVGQCDDRIEVLEAAIEYLKRHKGQ